MDVGTFRCPTCIAVLADARARRCSNCGQNIRKRLPRVLGEENRLSASPLPIDRWMLARLHTGAGRRHRKLPPVAWRGRFATSPLAEPDFAAMPSPIATPLAPPTEGVPTDANAVAPVAPVVPVAPFLPAAPSVGDEPITNTPPVISALELDVYTQRGGAPPASVRPALDPEVRALVDELYRQARAELAGDELAFFTPNGDAPDEDPPHVATEPSSRASTPPAPSPESRPTKTGWVPAFVADDRTRDHLKE